MRKIYLLSLVAAFVATLTLPVGADEVFTPDKTEGPVGTTVTFQDTYCFAGSGGWARAYIGADQSTPWTYTEATAAPATGAVGNVQVVVPANAVVGAAQLWVECEEGNLPDGPPGYISPPQDFTVTAGGGGSGGGTGGSGGDTGSGGTDVGGSGADNAGDTGDTGGSAPAPAPVSAMPTFTG